MLKNLNLNQLRVFHAVAKRLSFTLAAGDLHLTQSGVSKQVKELEHYFRTPLFQRLGKKVTLTQAGELLFQATADISQRLEAAKTQLDALQGLQGGRLSLGASITIGTHLLPEYLVRFTSRFPAVKIRAEVVPSARVVELLLGSDIEVGLIGHSSRDRRLVTRRFMTDRLVLIVPLGHVWARGAAPVALSALAGQRCILPQRGSGTRKILETALTEIGCCLENTLEFGTTEGVKQAVAAGLGVAVVSRHAIVGELAADRLAAVPLTSPDLRRPLFLAWHVDRYLSVAAQAFVETVRSAPPPDPRH